MNSAPRRSKLKKRRRPHGTNETTLASSNSSTLFESVKCLNEKHGTGGSNLSPTSRSLARANQSSAPAVSTTFSAEAVSTHGSKDKDKLDRDGDRKQIISCIDSVSSGSGTKRKRNENDGTIVSSVMESQPCGESASIKINVNGVGYFESAKTKQCPRTTLQSTNVAIEKQNDRHANACPTSVLGFVDAMNPATLVSIIPRILGKEKLTLPNFQRDLEKAFEYNRKGGMDSAGRIQRTDKTNETRDFLGFNHPMLGKIDRQPVQFIGKHSNTSPLIFPKRNKNETPHHQSENHSFGAYMIQTQPFGRGRKVGDGMAIPMSLFRFPSRKSTTPSISKSDPSTNNMIEMRESTSITREKLDKMKNTSQSSKSSTPKNPENRDNTTIALSAPVKDQSLTDVRNIRPPPKTQNETEYRGRSGHAKTTFNPYQTSKRKKTDLVSSTRGLKRIIPEERRIDTLENLKNTENTTQSSKTLRQKISENDGEVTTFLSTPTKDQPSTDVRNIRPPKKIRSKIEYTEKSGSSKPIFNPYKNSKRKKPENDGTISVNMLAPPPSRPPYPKYEGKVQIISMIGATIREQYDIDKSSHVLGKLPFQSERYFTEKKILPAPPIAILDDDDSSGVEEECVNVIRYKIVLESGDCRDTVTEFAEKDMSGRWRLGWISDRGRLAEDSYLILKEFKLSDTGTS